MTSKTAARTLRITPQSELPVAYKNRAPSGYDIYPTHPLPPDQIYSGYDSLADMIARHKQVVIDGFIGVFFEEIRYEIEHRLTAKGFKSSWTNITGCLKSAKAIEALTAPFLPDDDPVFGTRCNLQLSDYFETEKLAVIAECADSDIHIIYGTGAFLSGSRGLKIYIDLPKNELQYRARAQSVTNLGMSTPMAPATMYKRFYFVDWPILNRHKQEYLASVQIFIDGQRTHTITWIKGEYLRKGLKEMAVNLFRVRPWFEPGAWGGSWCLQHIESLPKSVPNYAWSFELIVPENGLLFESSGLLLEASFDSLMYLEAETVLGDAFPEFGTDFPIRFDFLDTFEGGNLSIQCHPNKAYTAAHFNENFTQEETYYILDAKEDATLFLGFQEDIDPDKFKTTLTESFEKQLPVDIGRFVQQHPAEKHHLYLIPPGTIHSAGRNNLVLEISATPYIFTFKLYDWLRPDLNGNLRPLNIERGMDNLRFDRKGAVVKKELISIPETVESDENWKLVHLPTHPDHLYDVYRYHLDAKSRVLVKTKNKFHAMNLVQGDSLRVQTKNGHLRQINYAETFVVPAGAGEYTLINDSDAPMMVIQALVKDKPHKNGDTTL